MLLNLQNCISFKGAKQTFKIFKMKTGDEWVLTIELHPLILPKQLIADATIGYFVIRNFPFMPINLA